MYHLQDIDTQSVITTASDIRCTCARPILTVRPINGVTAVKPIPTAAVISVPHTSVRIASSCTCSRADFRSHRVRVESIRVQSSKRRVPLAVVVDPQVRSGRLDRNRTGNSPIEITGGQVSSLEVGYDHALAELRCGQEERESSKD
jgi:hypothetical protein